MQKINRIIQILRFNGINTAKKNKEITRSIKKTKKKEAKETGRKSKKSRW